MASFDSIEGVSAVFSDQDLGAWARADEPNFCKGPGISQRWVLVGEPDVIYTREHPDDRVLSTLRGFYTVADDPTRLDDFVGHWTPGGIFIMGASKSVGHGAILEFITKGVDGPVKARKHQVERTYVSQMDRLDVTVVGTVQYILRNGKKVDLDFATRVKFVDVEGVLKFDFYQTFLVGSSFPDLATNFLMTGLLTSR